MLKSCIKGAQFFRLARVIGWYVLRPIKKKKSKERKLEMAFWFLVFCSIVSTTLAGKSDIHAVVLKTLNEETETATTGGTAVEYELLLDIKNEGPENLSPSAGSLHNFIFTAEVNTIL